MALSSAPNLEIVALDRAQIKLEAWRWPFATERRQDIDRNFAALRRGRAAVWNGRILLLHRYAIAGGILRGVCFETDYASLCAWRDWNFPDAGVYNFFAASALRSADGAFLVGEMASSTANAGLLTFPCGTPEPGDVGADGVLDLAGHLARELLEETGLGVGELDAEPGWTMVRDGGYLALLKRLTARQNADALRARIMASIAAQERPEFTALRIVRSEADFDSAMPHFVTAFLTHYWTR